MKVITHVSSTGICRAITVETLPDGTRQAFYQSSGRNSKMPKTWLPFDGFAPPSPWSPCGWFDKARFVCKYHSCDIPPELNRYGTELLKDISRRMAKRKINNLRDVTDPAEVNRFINTPLAISYAEAWDQKNLTKDSI